MTLPARVEPQHRMIGRRPAMYAMHEAGKIISRASGQIYDLTEAEDTALNHLRFAITHPSDSTAEAHEKLAVDMARAIRQAREK